MASLIKKALDYKMDRRAFLKGAAATSAGVALAGHGGLVKVPEAWAKAKAAEIAQKEGKWIPAACWHDCGGRCLNVAYVVDGIAIRQKTDDTHPDSPDYPQQRSCARGHSQRMHVFGADRIKYPMKRKHWEPGGGDKSLRGRDEWVRISWDEALDLVASEIKRIRETYGEGAFLVGGHRVRGGIGRTLAHYGGTVSAYAPLSYGTFLKTPELIGFDSGITDRISMRSCNLIVIWGWNSSISSAGDPAWNFLQSKKSGAKFIAIDPYYTNTIQAIADEWIPIRPGTDHAMLLGMAYTLITEDDPITNPLIDWDFLNRCTVGFDRDHMPEGADPNENFRDYVLGLDEKGNPAPEGHKNYPAKTPEWASEICGVDPQRIRSLAIEIGSTRKVAMLVSWVTGRINNSDSWPQMFMTLGCMTGHMGQSGRMTGASTHSSAGNGGPRLFTCDTGGSCPTYLPDPVDPTASGVGYHTLEVIDTGLGINHNELWDAVLTGKYTQTKGPKKDINIQCIYNGEFWAGLEQVVDLNKGIAAHRKVEFTASHHFVLNTSAKYADIVLPVITPWEKYGYVMRGNREALFWYSQVTEPLYEAKHDNWIAREIGRRLGLDDEALHEIYPMDDKQRLFPRIAAAQAIKEDGKTFEPMVTITEADIAELGVEGEPQVGRISWKEFKEKGVFQVPRSPGDNFGFIPLAAFREDPENNPLKTASGKMEIHCQALADYIDWCGWTQVRPIPTYNPPIEGYEDTFSDWEQKVKGSFPLQLLNSKSPRCVHSTLNNVPWLREAFPNKCTMNPIDAAERGISEDDIVLVTSRHGKVLRPVHLTERIMPGVCGLSVGAWLEIDEETGIDKAGNPNMLLGGNPNGQGTEGYNSCNIQVEKYVGPIRLEPDWKWPQRIPVKEA
jgi:anaerobic dimethyl sulfoxide reductase subunit A